MTLSSTNTGNVSELHFTLDPGLPWKEGEDQLRPDQTTPATELASTAPMTLSTLEFLERIRHIASRAGDKSVSDSCAAALVQEARDLLAERSRWDVNLAEQ